MKDMKKSYYYAIILGIILLSFLISGYFYPMMPDNVASHWGANGDVNGWMPKMWGVFFMPILSLFLLLIFIIAPRMDPKWKNIQKFENYFNRFICVLFVFLFYIFLLTTFWNLNFRFNMIQLLSPAFAILFFTTGILIEHTLPNFMIGIRTPWTIASDEVWKKTHKLGGKLFKISGALCLLGIIFPLYAIWFILIPVIGFSVGVMIYSYWIYKNEE
jgi:uncharacterized membrane protein